MRRGFFLSSFSLFSLTRSSVEVWAETRRNVSWEKRPGAATRLLLSPVFAINHHYLIASHPPSIQEGVGWNWGVSSAKVVGQPAKGT